MLQKVHSRVNDLTLSSSICHETILSLLWSINFVNHETNHAVLKARLGVRQWPSATLKS